MGSNYIDKGLILTSAYSFVDHLPDLEIGKPTPVPQTSLYPKDQKKKKKPEITSILVTC